MKVVFVACAPCNADKDTSGVSALAGIGTTHPIVGHAGWGRLQCQANAVTQAATVSDLAGGLATLLGVGTTPIRGEGVRCAGPP